MHARAALPLQFPMLARNLTHFVRLLRNAGMPLAPSRAVDAIEALSHIDIGRRDDVKAALSALLVDVVIGEGAQHAGGNPQQQNGHGHDGPRRGARRRCDRG